MRSSALLGAFLSTWQGRGSASGDRGYNGISTLYTSLNSGTLLLWQSWFPPQAFPVVDFFPPIPSGCLLAANSSPPPGLLSNPHVPAFSPCVHQQTHVPVWGMQGYSTDNLYRSHSVLSATDWPFHPPLTASDAPFLSQQIAPLVMGLPGCRNLSSVSAPPWGTDPILLPLLFFFPSFFHSTQLCGDLSCPFWCPRSSASVQPVFCENCSICRCILDAFVERDELHVLLLHQLRDLAL